MVLKLGINEWPVPGRIVRRETYMQEYNELAHTDGIAVCAGCGVEGSVLLRGDFVCGGVMRGGVWAIRTDGRTGPEHYQTVPKPDFFFLWIYTVLSYLPPSMETPFILIVPMVAWRF